MTLSKLIAKCWIITASTCAILALIGILYTGIYNAMHGSVIAKTVLIVTGILISLIITGWALDELSDGDYKDPIDYV